MDAQDAIVVLGPPEARHRLERTAARFEIGCVPAPDELAGAPAAELLEEVAKTGAGWLWAPFRSPRKLLPLAQAAEERGEAGPRLLAPSFEVLSRLAGPHELDALAEAADVRRPRVDSEEDALRWGQAGCIEVWLARDRHGGIAVLGEVDASLQCAGEPLLAESAPPLLLTRVDGQAIAEALREAARRVVETAGGEGLFGVVFLLDPDLRSALQQVVVGLPHHHALLEMTGGLDLLEVVLALHRGEPVPEDPRPFRADAHAVTALVRARRAAPKDGQDPEPVELHWPPVQPGKVRIETLREPQEAFPEEGLHPVLRVTAMGTVRHHAVQRLDRALVSLRLRGLEPDVARLRAVLGHETFRAGRSDLQLVERIEAELRARREEEARARSERGARRGGRRRR